MIKKIFLLLIILVAGLVHPVLALTPEQKLIFDSNIDYFDIDTSQPAACGTSIVPLTGSQNGDKIWNFLIAQGLKPPQAAGFMGNLEAESGRDPRKVQGGGESDYVISGKGYGLSQWTEGGRQKALIAVAQSRGTIHGDLGTQLEFTMQELNGGYKGTYNALRSTEDVDKATDIILEQYERPFDQGPSEHAKRRGFSRAILSQYGSTAPANAGNTDPSSGSSTICTSSGSGQVSGGYSLPVDRHFYDENPGGFSAPHHDYPAADIPVPTGTNVYSMTAGKIILAPSGGDCGNGVFIDAGNGTIFGYCHGLDGGSIPGAHQGDTVNPGQLIMHSDSTGDSSGPHLHVQIEVNNQKRCPQGMFKGIAEGAPPTPSSLPSSGCTN